VLADAQTPVPGIHVDTPTRPDIERPGVSASALVSHAVIAVTALRR
jgi:hypothetical protein